MSRVVSLLLVVSGLVLLALLNGCQRAHPEAQMARVRTVTVNDVPVDYLDWGGEGDPLLFITGSGNQPEYFEELAPHLTCRFRVLVLHGPITDSTGAGNPDALCGFLDRLGIERVHLAFPTLNSPRLSRFAALFPQRTGTLFCLELDQDRARGASSYYGFPSAYGSEMLIETRRAYWASVAERMKT